MSKNSQLSRPAVAENLLEPDAEKLLKDFFLSHRNPSNPDILTIRDYQNILEKANTFAREDKSPRIKKEHGKRAISEYCELKGIIYDGFEYDGAGNRIYPVIEAAVGLDTGHMVNLPVLEALAARYDVPHFKVPNFEVVKNGCGMGLRDGKRWTAHFIHIPPGVIITSFEPFEGTEPEGE